MATLADAIERYIKQLFEQASRDLVEVRRIDLAERFACVPSQINYVLETRFTLERGYVVESRRGGGGYIRIVRISSPSADRVSLLRWVIGRIGPSISDREARVVVDILEDAGVIDPREAIVWRMTLEDQTVWAPAALQDRVRASLLRSVLMVRFAALQEESDAT